jgi:hypothetical protein
MTDLRQGYGAAGEIRMTRLRWVTAQPANVERSNGTALFPIRALSFLHH